MPFLLLCVREAVHKTDHLATGYTNKYTSLKSVCVVIHVKVHYVSLSTLTPSVGCSHGCQILLGLLSAMTWSCCTICLLYEIWYTQMEYICQMYLIIYDMLDSQINCMVLYY